MTEKNNILVLNCGSSSLKFALIDVSTGEEDLNGLAEKLGQNDASLTIKQNGKKTTQPLYKNNNHSGAIRILVDALDTKQLSQSITAIGHRVVHGGETFTQSVLIDDEVLQAIKNVSSLAPLHNPANIIGIKAAQDAFPGLPQVAVFDTAFHQTMPQHAYLYAVDTDLYKEHGIRRYGFHGTSHFYVMSQAAKHLKQAKDQTSVITAHLGNGCSIAAIDNGQSVDTSMGMTPLEGLVMGTRSGDLDPGIIVHLMKHLDYSAEAIDNLLNKKSGLQGLSQISNDCRTLEEQKDKVPAAKLALDVFCYRIAKYIASYMVALSHLDALVFTGGIGENSSYIREQVIKQLHLIGFKLDSEKNNAARFGAFGEIHASKTSTPILVIPTNEEWVIANDAANIVREASEQKPVATPLATTPATKDKSPSKTGEK